MSTINPDELLKKHTPGWSLEQSFYTDPQIFDLEWEYIWKKYWLFAGPTAELPKAGDYFTYTAYKDSIIIIRGTNGEAYAHYNTCRHRGSLICIEEKGNAPKLICPYHQWVYDKDGSLLKAHLMPEDFDTSLYGLHPVHIQVANGLIFISLADNPPDFTKVLQDYAPFLNPYNIDKAKVAYKKRYELRTNWKFGKNKQP
jgi:phenylpropionate dioxygenase-like ring-hydroxylating dioxygenase large terminal subunit